ncbi:MAG: SGNH/GDSL hydrolase family protein [Saprospiraceae bacterium]
MLIDQERNLTKALSFSPYAVVINMPSNDAANNFTVGDQLRNYRIITEAATAAGVLTWVATPQPRNFTTFSQIQLQRDVRDSILQIYGDQAIEFWDGIAEEDGHILAAYNAGDGVHLNNAGHAILFERVFAKGIQDIDCLDWVAVDTPPALAAKASLSQRFPTQRIAMYR